MTDPLALARIQFGANITFHILFPTINLALSWVLCYIKCQINRPNGAYWLQCYKLWIKIFALTFALGVVSGITMSAQFGTNWPGFMTFSSAVAGPLLSYEVLSAFFLEATFLGIMLYGQKRVSQRLHTVSCFIVAFGTTLSAFWIMCLSSWMQTPDGVTVIHNKITVLDWWRVIFNPSMSIRLIHMLLASGITTGFLIIGVSCYRIRRGVDEWTLLQRACICTLALCILQIFNGDLLGLNSHQHQPAKVAAIEGVWQDQYGAPMLLFAWPNESKKTNDYAIGIPKLASLILTHQPNGLIKGLTSFPDKPKMAPVFWSFRVMIATGLFMLFMSLFGTIACYKKTSRFGEKFIALAPYTTFIGWLATCAGWYVTEMGRQPWLIYGYLKTHDAASHIPAHTLQGSLLSYCTLYVFLIGAYISTVFYCARRYDLHKS